MLDNEITLGDRMKNYEKSTRQYLDKTKPVIIRLDGKAFHTFTKRFIRPFDDIFIDLMNKTAEHLCKYIQGAKIAYVQSDEITIVLDCSNNPNADLWYGGEIQKIVSVSASEATAIFNKLLFIHILTPHFNTTIFDISVLTNSDTAKFDSRVFNVDDKDEVTNNILWRQRDCIKNSISTVAQSNFSDKELHKKNGDDKKAMLLEKGVDWNALDNSYKNGRLVTKKEELHKNQDGTSYVRTKWLAEGMEKILPNTYLYDM